MTLWEIVCSSEDGHFDYDVYDFLYDRCVTVSIDKDDEENDDPYYQFIVELLKHVEYEDYDEYVETVYARWYKLIEDNMELFRKFANEHWYRTPEGDEDFVYEWIRELHYYVAGYVSEGVYKAFLDDILNHIEVCR